MNTEIGLQILRNQMTMMDAIAYCIKGQPSEVLSQKLILGISQEFYSTSCLLTQQSLHESELMQLSKRGFGSEN